MDFRQITRALLLCAGVLPLLSTQANAAPKWTQIKLPSTFSKSSIDNLFPASDGNVYATTVAGGYVTSIYRASLTAVSGGSPTWTAIGTITHATCPYCSTETPTTLTATPNGTIFIAMTNGADYSDVLVWNGSTSKPSWTRVTGYSGVSSSYIYNFATDSSGYTYFSPAWGGDIWRNDTPNSSAFTKQVSNVYKWFGYPAGGGIYQAKILNLGSGDQFWGCGEGPVLNSPLAFNSVDVYMDSGYRGNCTNVAASPTTILVTRTSTYPNDLSGIDTSTMAVTDHSCPEPRTATGCVSMAVNTGLGGLNWLYGTNFVWNAQETSSYNFYLLMSNDDGNTWNNITTGLGSSCTGSNMSLQQWQSYQPPHDIFAKCQKGKVYWHYGPV